MRIIRLFKGVEIIVQVLCAAAVKISAECDLEYLVSIYEKHFKADRQLENLKWRLQKMGHCLTEF